MTDKEWERFQFQRGLHKVKEKKKIKTKHLYQYISGENYIIYAYEYTSHWYNMSVTHIFNTLFKIPIQKRQDI